jgi:hypothetical protein
MADDQTDRPVLYVPDSPNTLEASGTDPDDRRAAIKEQTRAADLAEKLAIGDELSGYEKVAGRGITGE